MAKKYLVIGGFGIVAALLVWAGPPTEKMHKVQPGQVRPFHHTDDGFRNLEPDASEHSFSDMLRWRRERKKNGHASYDDWVNRLPVTSPDWETIRNPGTDMVFTWLGHATFLVQMDGINMLTDPMFSERASPVQFAGPKRITKFPIDPADLPPIDIVVISHNHYDHLDLNSVQLLGNSPLWFVPLGLKSWFKRQGITNVVELDWWESYTLSSGATVTLTPARHFSARTLWNRNKILWGSWLMQSHNRKIYFAGDTGYGMHFRQIGDRFGPIDVSLIPIGAYNPEWFMGSVHINPRQVIQAHLDLKSVRTIAMHWGTFILTDEPVDEPPRLFKEAAAAMNISDEHAIILQHGATRIIP